MRCLLLAAAIAALALPAAAAAGNLRVANDRTGVATKLGHKFVFHTRIENRGSEAASGLVAHLNVVDLSGHTYVDPEDWSSHRTKFLPTIPAGGSVTVNWPMEAVNHGSFDVYVTLITPDASGKQPAIGPAVHIAVADRKTLNSGGILPLALGIPAALGLLTLGLRYRRRQR
jgi:hypothetical protein